MKDYYCFEIEFPEINFDNYYIKCDSVSKIYHAHLYTHDNQIELRIFYNDKTYFGEKISMWASKINWRKFGTYIKLRKENKNDRLQRIDLSSAKLLGINNSTSYYDGNSKFVKIKINTAKFYWNPVKEEVNTAEFYLNDAGFKVVKNFYSTLFGWDDKFNISRMKGMDAFYPVGKSEFRPEFNFCFSDDRSKREVIITKEPKLQFRYKENVSEDEAILYGEVVCLLASFFFHTKIDFTFKRIHLPEHTITIKKIEQKNIIETSGGLWAFKNYMDFHKLLQENWQPKTFANFKKLSKAVKLFNQALLVDSSSEFLIRYNIIEICNDGQQSNEKFKEVLKRKSRKKKYDEALKLLLQTISPEEHTAFASKWNSLSGKLTTKPMKSPLLLFFESQNLKPSDFPISVKEIKELRDNITHGSIAKINLEQLRKANILLYRITGILILNLIGIDKWELNKELT
ncbi:hypothetical protein ES705_07143 [subsurface metagenome]